MCVVGLLPLCFSDTSVAMGMPSLAQQLLISREFWIRMAHQKLPMVPRFVATNAVPATTVQHGHVIAPATHAF